MNLTDAAALLDVSPRTPSPELLESCCACTMSWGCIPSPLIEGASELTGRHNPLVASLLVSSGHTGRNQTSTPESPGSEIPEFIAHAPQDNNTAPAFLATNQHSLAMPGMPKVSDLSMIGFMGVSCLGCTIEAVLTSVWGRECQNAAQHSRRENIVIAWNPTSA